MKPGGAFVRPLSPAGPELPTSAPLIVFDDVCVLCSPRLEVRDASTGPLLRHISTAGAETATRLRAASSGPHGTAIDRPCRGALRALQLKRPAERCGSCARCGWYIENARPAEAAQFDLAFIGGARPRRSWIGGDLARWATHGGSGASRRALPKPGRRPPASATPRTSHGG
jgi:hypothetical protein